MIFKDLTIYHALSHAVVGSRSENITMDNANVKINRKGTSNKHHSRQFSFLNCKVNKDN